MNNKGDGNRWCAMLTVKQVSQQLGVSIQTVYALIAKRQLPVYRIGANGRGAIRIRTEDVEKFLESCRISPPSPPRPKGAA